MSAIGRIQWSRLGVTVYDGDGAFVTRIEHPHDRHFLNEIIVAALKKISDEQLARRTFASAMEPDEVTGAAV